MTYEEWRDEAATAVTLAELPSKAGIKRQCFILGADGCRNFMEPQVVELIEKLARVNKILKAKNEKIKKLQGE